MSKTLNTKKNLCGGGEGGGGGGKSPVEKRVK